MAHHGARNVRIFGSVARGQAGPDSDVDVVTEKGLREHPGQPPEDRCPRQVGDQQRCHPGGQKPKAIPDNLTDWNKRVDLWNDGGQQKCGY